MSPLTLVQEEAPAVSSGRQELVAFEVCGVLLGLGIENVREIRRDLGHSRAPHAPPYVRGVTNLRGETLTVVDLGVRLGLGRVQRTRQSRQIVVEHGGEHLALLVDRVEDVLEVPAGSVRPTPANVGAGDARFLAGVYERERDAVAVLRLDEVLREEPSDAPVLEESGKA